MAQMYVERVFVCLITPLPPSLPPSPPPSLPPPQVFKPEVWHRIPGPGAVEKVQAMLLEKIKAEGLRTYLFTFSPFYDSLSLPQLCSMFEMERYVHPSLPPSLLSCLLAHSPFPPSLPPSLPPSQ